MTFLQPWADGEEGLIECEAEKGELRSDGDSYGATGGTQEQVTSLFFFVLLLMMVWMMSCKNSHGATGSTQVQVTLLLLIFYCIVFGAVLHDFVVDVVERVTSLFFVVVVHHKS